jgi:predicted pyridoxine 5'-phosphate oxidase superfamily flavin-nucleotide-binding protein
MVALTDEMKEIFAKNKIFPMATASRAGVPNVAPMASVRLASDDTVWIMDNYMVKSLSNLRENAGPDYETFRSQMKAKSDKYPAKSLIVVKITEVFECTPGKEAGKKVL